MTDSAGFEPRPERAPHPPVEGIAVNAKKNELAHGR